MADEPEKLGGWNAGPTPYHLLLASLGTCTAMTIRLFAVREGMPLDDVAVGLRHDRVDRVDCDAQGKNLAWAVRSVDVSIACPVLAARPGDGTMRGP